MSLLVHFPRNPTPETSKIINFSQQLFDFPYTHTRFYTYNIKMAFSAQRVCVAFNFIDYLTENQQLLENFYLPKKEEKTTFKLCVCS